MRNSITLTSAFVYLLVYLPLRGANDICAIFIMVRSRNGVVGRSYRASALPVAYGVGRAVAPYVQRLAQLGYNRVSDAWRGRKRPRPYQSKSSAGFSKGKVRQRGQYSSTGTIGRPFKKGRKFKKSTSFQTQGYELHTESGDVYTNDEIAYVGHGVAQYQLCRAVFGAMVRKLIMKAGIRVTDPSTPLSVGGVNAGFRISITYTLVLGGVPAVTSTDFDKDSVFETVVNSLTDTIFSVASNNSAYYINKIDMFMADTTFNFVQMPSSTLDMTDCKVTMRCSSRMTLQNRTLATDSGLGIDQNRNDIANNPLSGKIYSGSGNGAGFRVLDNTAPILPLSASFDKGVIEANLSAAAVGSGQLDAYRRPPMGSAFRFVNKSVSVALNPGVLRTSSFVWERTMVFQKFLEIMRNVMGNAISTTTNIRSNMGKFEFFCLEKRCNTRSSEPTISLGYELDQKYSASIKWFPKKMIPKTYIL